MSEPYTILSLDQASHFCGFAVGKVYPNRKVVVANHGTIKLGNSHLGYRLLELRRDLDCLVKNYRPNVVVIEQQFFYSQQTLQTIKALGAVTGICEMVACDHGLPVEEIHPGTWKSDIGAESKATVPRRVCQYFDIPEYVIKDDNNADALGILASKIAEIEKQREEQRA